MEVVYAGRRGLARGRIDRRTLDDPAGAGRPVPVDDPCCLLELQSRQAAARHCARRLTRSVLGRAWRRASDFAGGEITAKPLNPRAASARGAPIPQTELTYRCPPKGW